MNIADILSNDQVLEQLARSTGIDPKDARGAMEALLPSVARGIERNASNPGGLDALAGALSKGGHARYLDQPESLAEPSTVADGKAVLGHIFGSKDVSRNVAAHAAGETGLDSGLLRKLLPVVASVAMAALSKNSNGGQQLQGSGSQGSDLLGSVLGSVMRGMTDQKQGSAAPTDPLDGILDLAKKFY